MLFEHPSTRTRISFEAGMTELGGHAQNLRPGEIHLGGHETLADTARVISRLVDAIMARTAFHATLAELVENATVPVINGLTDDYDHPVQTMTDAFTVLEHLGTVDGLTCAFVGKCADAMGTSVALTMSRLGSSMVMAAPPEEQMTPEVEALVRANCAQSGASLTLTDDAVEAVAQADVVFTVGWWWMQPEDEKNELRRILRPYQRGAVGARQARGEVHALPAGDPRRRDDRRDPRRPLLDRPRRGREPQALTESPAAGPDRHRRAAGRPRAAAHRSGAAQLADPTCRLAGEPGAVGRRPPRVGHARRGSDGRTRCSS